MSIIQFFAMQETLCIYRFWAFGEKTPSLLFMLRKEEFLCLIRIIHTLWKHQCFVNNRSLFLHQNWWSCNSQLTLCLGIFSFFIKHSPKIGLASNWCYWCDMMYDVKLCDMMRWYDAKNDANAEDTYPRWNTISASP